MNKEVHMNKRASGRTTRLVDGYVQKFFNEGSTGAILDHHDDRLSHTYLASRVRNRLTAEFSHIKFKIHKHPDKTGVFDIEKL